MADQTGRDMALCRLDDKAQNRLARLAPLGIRELGLGTLQGCLGALMVAWAGIVFAQAPDGPPSQAAFRAAIQGFYEMAQAEKNDGRFADLERSRAAALAKTLGPDLQFQGWTLELKGIEPTPRGGYFVRFIDPALADLRLPRPTFWNGGPGRITRECAIPVNSRLYDVLKKMKPGAVATVSGRFFPDENNGPVFESAKLNFRANEVELAKFRTPYFSVQFTEIVAR